MLVIGKKAGEIIKKYRYVLIILVVGVLLMLIPEIKTKNKTVDNIVIKLIFLVIIC